MPTVVSFRDPTDEDLGSADLLGLLESASGCTGSALQSRAVDVRISLTTIVALVDGRLMGFAAYDADDIGTVVLHYLAVDESQRGTGIGRRLVAGVRDAVRGACLIAETDDDTVEFYRRSGFAVAPLPRDPRWPDVQRYRCVLAAEPG